jgi:hypothetical protein
MGLGLSGKRKTNGKILGAKEKRKPKAVIKVRRKGQVIVCGK